ncbi:MAG: DUF1343 domain-containing protein [Bacteroidota bacterium]|nr:DUF1343 domain-containing protein [Bacteroidota bacterium]MDP4246405.1 DUF1343 domain-containing protein [Bacteroidota bacterium]
MRVPILVLTLLVLHAGIVQGQRRPSGAVTPPILTGADQMSQYLPLLKGASIAVFANQTSMVGKTHLVDTLLKKGIHIRKIFSPEHGFRGDADAGEHVNDLQDPRTGIPIISLYGTKRKPSAADLAGIDILLFDIQDVGVRFYTYISSLQEFIEAAIENNRPLIILDRPDPNGFYVDGPVLDPRFKSFVGMQPVPIVYGMTIGEYAHMLVGELWLDPTIIRQLSTIHAINESANRIDSQIGAMRKRPAHLAMHDFRLIVIPCRNYSHKSRYSLPVKPSPNLPNMQSVYLYPSLCLFEGTPVSLGRGTDKPFQQFGHPAFPSNLYRFVPRSVEDAKNPPLLDKTCYGYDLSRINVSKETGDRLCLKWLIQAYQLYPDKEHFFSGSSNFFNKLAGNDQLKQQLIEGKTEEEIRKSWEPALGNFLKIRKKYLLYPDFGP